MPAHASSLPKGGGARAAAVGAWPKGHARVSTEPPKGPAAHTMKLGPLLKAEQSKMTAHASSLPSNGGDARAAVGAWPKEARPREHRAALRAGGARDEARALVEGRAVEDARARVEPAKQRRRRARGSEGVAERQAHVGAEPPKGPAAHTVKLGP